jgi:hypothetical protein
VRLTARGQPDQVAETIIRAKQDCLSVLLVVPVGASFFYDQGADLDNDDSAPRSKARRARRGLSQLDLNLLRQNFAQLIGKLDAAHVSVDTFEIGNEINWSGFNADFTEIGRYYDDAGELNGSRSSVVEGLRQYAKAVKVIRDILRTSSYQKRAAVIGAGMMSGTREFIERSGGSALSPKAINQMLTQLGVTNDLDGFAIHIYPKEGADAINDTVSHALDECAPQGRDCYVTEWGFVLRGNGCPSPDPRNADFRLFLDDVRKEEATHPVKGVYVYDWDVSPARTLYRCGHFLPDPGLFR